MTMAKSGSGGPITMAGDTLDYELVEESVQDNPYLRRFYADMPRWAFHLNMYFLGSRSQALLRGASPSTRGRVFDRSLYEDRIFVDLAHEDGITPADNYAVFCSLHDTLIRFLPRPTLLIYLHAPVAVIHDRIARRGRPYEKVLTVDYLARIQDRYCTWIEQYDRSPVLRVDSGAVDFRSDAARDLLCRQIIEATVGQ